MGWFEDFTKQAANYDVDGKRVLLVDRAAKGDPLEALFGMPAYYSDAVRLTRDDIEQLLAGKVLAFSANDEYKVVIYVE